MSRLEYILDKRKLLKTEYENLPNFNPANYFDNAAQAEQAIKGQFQVMMQNPNNQIFETMWTNADLRSSLWNSSLTQQQARTLFNSWVTNGDDLLFNFIKVE